MQYILLRFLASPLLLIEVLCFRWTSFHRRSATWRRPIRSVPSWWRRASRRPWPCPSFLPRPPPSEEEDLLGSRAPPSATTSRSAASGNRWLSSRRSRPPVSGCRWSSTRTARRSASGRRSSAVRDCDRGDSPTRTSFSRRGRRRGRPALKHSNSAAVKNNWIFCEF